MVLAFYTTFLYIARDPDLDLGFIFRVEDKQYPFGGTKLENSFEKSKHLSKVKLLSDTLQRIINNTVNLKL